MVEIFSAVLENNNKDINLILLNEDTIVTGLSVL